MTATTKDRKPNFLTPIKAKLAFITKLIMSVLISYSFARFSDFYLEYPFIYNLAVGLNTFLTASVLISIGRFLLVSWYSRQHRGSERIRGNVLLGIGQIAVILNAVFGVVGMMLVLGINPKDFLTSITLVAMAIALLFKDYITNMISGLLLMFSERFTIGDFIKIGEDQGKIIDLTLSNIVIRNEDDDVVLIPNNAAFTVNIINQTLENTRKMIVEFKLPFEYAHRKSELEAHLHEEIKNLEDQIQMEHVRFRIVSVNHNEVHYKLSLNLNTRTKAKKSEIKGRLLDAALRFTAQEQPSS